MIYTGRCTCLVVADVVHAAGPCDLQHSAGDGWQVEGSQLVEGPVPVRLAGGEVAGAGRRRHMQTALMGGNGMA